jgi:hypothetical protein
MSNAEIKPLRIQRSRQRGSRLTSPNGLPVVCVTRGGMWGNPFKVGMDLGGGVLIDTPSVAVEAFQMWLDANPMGKSVAYAARRVLRGKNLACWCKPGEPCHADVLLKIANE